MYVNYLPHITCLRFLVCLQFHTTNICGCQPPALKQSSWQECLETGSKNALMVSVPQKLFCNHLPSSIAWPICLSAWEKTKESQQNSRPYGGHTYLNDVSGLCDALSLLTVRLLRCWIRDRSRCQLVDVSRHETLAEPFGFGDFSLGDALFLTDLASQNHWMLMLGIEPT